MSFILDALRKSEHERQRQTGPGLAEVAVSAPRTKTSLWATAAVVLLVANLIAVGVLMLRRARSSDAVEPASVAATVPAPVAPPSATPPPAAAAPTQSPAPASVVPPMMQPADPRAPAAGPRNPLEDEMAGDSIPPDPVLAERSASVPRGPPAVSEYPTRPGSVIYEPLGPGSPAAEVAPALPTIDDVSAVPGGLPEMHVDLHVYATNPQDRFVFVNKRKYREGETLQEGPRIEQITRDGVILNQQGRRFILPRQ